jgi:hypothetical protein
MIATVTAGPVIRLGLPRPFVRQLPAPCCRAQSVGSFLMKVKGHFKDEPLHPVLAPHAPSHSTRKSALVRSEKGVPSLSWIVFIRSPRLRTKLVKVDLRRMQWIR